MLSKRLVALDAAVARVFAKQMESVEGPAYLWADSSVQARVDWLLSTFDYIHRHDLFECYEAAIVLRKRVSGCESVCESDAEDRDEHLFVIAVDRLQKGAIISMTLHLHRQVPVAILNDTHTEAQGRGIADGCFIGAGGSTAQMLRFSRCINTFCPDRGTEFALADAEGGHMLSVIAVIYCTETGCVYLCLFLCISGKCNKADEPPD